MAIDYSVRIVADFDVNRFNAGVKNVKQGLEETSVNAKRTSKDLGDLKKSLEAGLGAIERVGMVAMGILTGIALASPKLADEWAKIKLEGFKLANIIGGHLEPYLKQFIGILDGINSFLEQNPLFAKLITDGLVLAGVLGTLSGALRFFGWLFSPLKSFAVSAINVIKGALSGLWSVLQPILAGIGALLGTGGAVATGLIGLAGGVGAWGATEIGKAIGTFGSGGGILDALGRIAHKVVGGATTGAGAALVLGQLGPQVATPEELVTVPGGAILGGLVGGLWGIGEELWNWFNKTGPYAPRQEVTIHNNIQIDGKTVATEINRYNIEEWTWMNNSGGVS